MKNKRKGTLQGKRSKQHQGAKQDPETESWLQAAKQHLQRQELDHAAVLCQRILARNPSHAAALHLLGGIALQRGNDAQAEALIRNAIAINDQRPAYHANHALVLRRLGLHQDALAACNAALKLNPNLADAHFHKGNLLSDLGQFEAAIAAYDNAIRLKRQYAEAHNNRGNALQQLSRYKDALDAYEQAIRSNPRYTQAHNNRGNVLKELGQYSQALKAFDNALRLDPTFAQAQFNRGNTLQELGRFAEALAAYETALQLNPNLFQAHNNRGTVLKHFGRIDHALLAYSKALQINPDYAEAHSNRLLTLHYSESASDDQLLATALHTGRFYPQSAQRVADHLVSAGDRRLRIGYVSGDFRRHAIAYFIEQLFAKHNRCRVELFAYSNNPHDDELTERIKAVTDHWRSITSLPDEAASQQIRQDAIDVLIDLSGHTAHHRLGIFARRAAPVQAHYLGFMGTTGLSTIDYWIGDPILTPASVATHYCETLWPLPRTWVAYGGADDAPAPTLPATQDGNLVLGSFNNLIKHTPATIALWSELLRALPEAQLLLKSQQLQYPQTRTDTLHAFGQHQISAERIRLCDGTDTAGWSEHMAYYNRIDVALDPIGGVGGGTTTCDALWMGVPVITLLGQRTGSRMSASMLNAIERQEWIAHSHEEYIGKAVDLARDQATRQAIRRTQRDQMRDSPLCQVKDLANALEDAFEAMFTQ